MGITSELTTYVTLPKDGEYWFTATVENGMRGLVRMNVARGKMESDAAENSQGMDLNPKECRALANLLMAAAETAEASLEGSD